MASRGGFCARTPVEPFEDGAAVVSQTSESVGDARLQHAQAIDHAAAEIDRRGFREISCRARDFADSESTIDRLRQHLIVEYEVVRISVQRKGLDHLPGEPAIARMIFRQFLAEQEVLQQSQK